MLNNMSLSRHHLSSHRAAGGASGSKRQQGSKATSVSKRQQASACKR